MDREILAVEVCNAPAISGNAGRYISMANGLMVERAPKIRIMKNRFGLAWDIILSFAWRSEIGISVEKDLPYVYRVDLQAINNH